jgi:hypothetical protein
VQGLRPGKHRLTVRAQDQKNRSARRTSVFRVCRRGAAATFVG